MSPNRGGGRLGGSLDSQARVLWLQWHLPRPSSPLSSLQLIPQGPQGWTTGPGSSAPLARVHPRSASRAQLAAVGASAARPLSWVPGAVCSAPGLFSLARLAAMETAPATCPAGSAFRPVAFRAPRTSCCAGPAPAGPQAPPCPEPRLEHPGCWQRCWGPPVLRAASSSSRAARAVSPVVQAWIPSCVRRKLQG